MYIITKSSKKTNVFRENRYLIFILLIKITKTGYIINDNSWFYSVSIITYLVLKLLNYDNDVFFGNTDFNKYNLW